MKLIITGIIFWVVGFFLVVIPYIFPGVFPFSTTSMLGLIGCFGLCLIGTLLCNTGIWEYFNDKEEEMWGKRRVK